MANLTPQQMSDLSDLALKIANNEKTRPLFAHLVKQVAPRDAQAAFPEVFLRQEMAAFKKTIDDDRLRDKAEKIFAEKQSQRRDIQTKRHLSDEQMNEVQKYYDRFGDWEAAAAVYADKNPPENPLLKPPDEIRDMGSTWDFPTVPGPDGKMLGFTDYIKNPRKYSNNIAIQMITDFKRGKLPAAFSR